MATPPIVLTPQQFTDFRTFIYAKCGIYFQEEKKYLLEGRLQQRISALRLPDAPSYLRYLQTDLNARNELNGLFDAITINETFFFRHPPQFDAFRDKILPEVVEARKKAGRNEVRVWSAACSTGDEPYTLAMLLREKLSTQAMFRAYIYACDLSPKVLIQAKTGIYNDYSVRNIPPQYRNQYIKALPDGTHQLDERVRSMVTFDQANLTATDHLPKTKDMDVIFCRNVLIYFDTPAKKKVIDNFHASLRPGGYLIIGPAESIQSLHTGFKMVLFNGAIGYRRE